MTKDEVELEQKLGSGAFSVVYKYAQLLTVFNFFILVIFIVFVILCLPVGCRGTLRGEPCAVKVLNVRDDAARAAFKKEVIRQRTIDNNKTDEKNLRREPSARSLLFLRIETPNEHTGGADAQAARPSARAAHARLRPRRADDLRRVLLGRLARAVPPGASHVDQEIVKGLLFLLSFS